MTFWSTVVALDITWSVLRLEIGGLYVREQGPFSGVLHSRVLGRKASTIQGQSTKT